MSQAQTTKPAGAAADLNLNSAMLARLDRVLPSVRFDGVGFADALDSLQRTSGVRIDAQWDKLEAAGIQKNKPMSMNLRNVTIADALNAVLASAAGKPGVLAYTIKEGAIVVVPVGPAGQTTRPAVSPADEAKLNAMVQAKLDRVLPAVTFDGVGFADVLDFLKDVSGVRIEAKWDGIRAAGIDKNSAISMNVRNAKFRNTLDDLLVKAAGKPGVLGYTIEKGEIVVGVKGATTQPK